LHPRDARDTLANISVDAFSLAAANQRIVVLPAEALQQLGTVFSRPTRGAYADTGSVTGSTINTIAIPPTDIGKIPVGVSADQDPFTGGTGFRCIVAGIADTRLICCTGPVLATRQGIGVWYAITGGYTLTVFTHVSFITSTHILLATDSFSTTYGRVVKIYATARPLVL
jgi:hypothetical protein